MINLKPDKNQRIERREGRKEGIVERMNALLNSAIGAGHDEAVLWSVWSVRSVDLTFW